MSNPVPQFGISYIRVQNRGTDTEQSLLVMLVNKLYNVNVSTTSKHANRVFISVRKGRLGTESGDSLLEVETAEPSFFDEIKQ